MVHSPWTSMVFYAAFIIFLGYFLLLTFYYLFLVIVGFIEGNKRARESEEEVYKILSGSTFTLPVSVIIPAHNEEEWIADSVGAALRSAYPEFEVIVVDDGSTDKTFEILDDMLSLKGYDKTYVEEYADGIVREIFRSDKYSNVTVISKKSGRKKAGAVNAGLNIAKYKYICVIDADTIMEPEAILKVMAHVHRDPDRIIGIGSYFGLCNGFNIKDGVVLERDLHYKPILAYQNLEYIRSFIGNRIAWSRFNAMPIVSGGFGIWRRDVIHEMGGFDAKFTCEDLEYTFRAHDHIVKNKEKGYKVMMLPYIAGWTEGPSDMRSLLIQRNRWQRVTDETVWKYRYMAFNPKYGGFGFLTLPYFILYEVLGVFFEIISLFMIGLGAIIGILDIKIFLAYFCVMVLSQALTSVLSIFTFLQVQRILKFNYVLYLVVLSFLEFFWYRWIISAAKIAGTYSYLMRDRDPTMYKREKRKL